MLPVAARCTPPETGQSTASAPVASTSAAMRRISAASVVDISSQILPGAMPERMPSALSITAADAAGDGRQVMTTSDILGHLPRAFGEAGTGGKEGFGSRAVEVAHREIDAVAQQRAGKLAAGMAEPDESDFHIAPPQP